MKFWLYQTLIALDQLVNALFGGWADETLSSRSHRELPRLARLIDRCIGEYFCLLLESGITVLTTRRVMPKDSITRKDHGSGIPVIGFVN